MSNQQNPDIPDQNIQPPKKWWKKSFNFFGKTIPLSVVLIILMAGTGLALLSVYITVTASVDVKQSVTLNAIESTWKYGLIPLTIFDDPGVTSFDEFEDVFAVAGDEQDIGLLLSNYAEIEAPIKIVKTITEQPEDAENCEDDKVLVYDDYTPSDYPACVGLTEQQCNGNSRCFWNALTQTCKGDEQCVGNLIEDTECDEENNVWTSGEILIQPRPNEQDSSIPFEDWVCVREQWDIAAVPGKYDFKIEVIPG